MKLSDKSPTSTHRVLVYGQPKCGKTELVGCLSQEFNLVWIDLEKGYGTLFKFPREWQERIDIIAIPDTKVFPIAIETCLKIVTGVEVKICREHGKVSCMLCTKSGAPMDVVHLNKLGPRDIVVYDSLTQLSNSAMNFLTKNQEDLYKPEWSDYRNQGQLLDKFLSQIQQAQYNVCCITHEVESELEDGKKKIVPVCGTSNFSKNTAKYFDHVVYCEVKNRKHTFASATTFANNILTGSRGDVAVEKDEVPTLLRIFKGEMEHSAQNQSATPARAAVSNLKTLVGQGGQK